MDPLVILILSHLAFQGFPVCHEQDPLGNALRRHLLMSACDKGDISYGDPGFTSRRSLGHRCINRRET